MSALPGDPTPNAFVFPPFAPPVARTARPAAEPPAPAEPLEEFGMEVPLPAHDLGDPDDLPRHGFDAAEAGTQPWEDAAPPATEDLPWLEMPAGGPRVHASEDPTPWETAGSQQPAADLAYDYTPAAEPVADFAYDFVPAAEPAASYEAPAETAWEPPFLAEPDAASPAEAALSAEIEPEDEFPVEAEAALAYEDAGFTEVPTSADFDEASQIMSAVQPDAAFMAAATAPAAEYGEVADRLETIARALRDDPAAFLAGGSGDALGLLVTGFVLGYGHGRRESGV